MDWLEGNKIKVEPPKKPKKITGTRFASVLGFNPWSSPFEAWCAITRTYEKPFEDTIYTTAGKTIEPKQIEYMKSAYAMDNLVTPTDVYGEDYFKATWGDFFPDSDYFGGMWDAYLTEDNTPATVIEFKTTKRSEDWADGAPEYYALQAALYAYLMGVDDVIMVASFLEEKDYEHPEDFVPSAENTITESFKVSKKYPDFELLVEKAMDWWQAHVVTGVSPEYNEKKTCDAEILKALRTTTLSPETDISDLIKEGEELKTLIDEVSKTITHKEKRLKEINDIIKTYAQGQFKEGDKKVEIPGSHYTWTISRSETESIDKDALKADGIYDKYTKKTESYRLTVK